MLIVGILLGGRTKKFRDFQLQWFILKRIQTAGKLEFFLQKALGHI